MALRALVPNHVGRVKPIKKKSTNTKRATQPREIGAGEFKAKCLALIDEVGRTGQEVIITKRGKAVAKLISFEEITVDSLFGRMKGLAEIVGNPDDLVKPAFPLEDWESLR